VFPNENEWTNNNTVDACLNQCAAFGYPAAGLEYGSQCCKPLDCCPENDWLTSEIVCGDITDVAANGGYYVADTQCNMLCSGDPTHLCGSNNLLTTYYWNGTMNTWHTPSNTGYYEASTTYRFFFSAAALTIDSFAVPDGRNCGPTYCNSRNQQQSTIP